MTKAYMQLDSGTIIETDTPEHWGEARRLPQAAGRKLVHAEQLAKLRKWFPRGSTVYTITRHVSRSGMQRHISVVALTIETGRDVAGGIAPLEVRTYHPNYAVATVLGRQLKSGWHDSIVCNGGGMDMGFDLAYSLSCALYEGDGYALHHKWL